MNPCDRLRGLLSPLTPEDLIANILTKRDTHWSVSVGYLYGANISSRHLLTHPQSLYWTALESLDYVAVDGIGLQTILWLDSVITKKSQPQRYPNCNGTDLLPRLLNQATKKYQTCSLVLYGSTLEQIKRTQDFLEKQGYHVIYVQDGYRPFDRDAYDHAAHAYTQHKKILIVGRSTISRPIQEERRYTERQKCHERGFCVCLQGGIFDHSSMGGKEKRAPLIIQRLKAERIRRLVINPHKNAKKVRYAVKVFGDWFLARLKN